MNVSNVGQTTVNSLNAAWSAVLDFIPNFLAGLIILLIGVIIASLLKQVTLAILRAINLEGFLKRYNVPQGKNDLTWTNILGEIVRWFVIIIFLIPTTDVWHLPQVDSVLRSILLYLPNVFVAVIIGAIGLVFARLAYDVVLASTRGVSADASKTLALATRWSVTIFTVLAVLAQLGVAADLVRILFTGFVAMFALAGGLAFGLGGQKTASDLLETWRKKLK